jgi:hypothetical protein
MCDTNKTKTTQEMIIKFSSMPIKSMELLLFYYSTIIHREVYTAMS